MNARRNRLRVAVLQAEDSGYRGAADSGKRASRASSPSGRRAEPREVTGSLARARVLA